MSNVRLSRTLCAAVGEVISRQGSHASLDMLFQTSGAPGDPPDCAHHSKWKEWLFRAGQDPEVDSLVVLGNVIEEFMDVAPEESSDEYYSWQVDRSHIEIALQDNSLQYYRFGRVLPQGATPIEHSLQIAAQPVKPSEVEDLLETIIRGLRRAMHPLIYRRKGAQSMVFGSEYDVQDLLHSMLRPWIKDIRPEEFTPSYGGSSTRMDFLLPAHEMVIETKVVRDRTHSKKVVDELIIDIEHYRKHPDCKRLWCVVYDPDQLLTNPDSLIDLQGERRTPDGDVLVKVLVT